MPRRRKRNEETLETSIIEIPALDAFAAEAEERGKVEAHELDAIVLEHELDEDAVTAFKALLAGRLLSWWRSFPFLRNANAGFPRDLAVPVSQ